MVRAWCRLFLATGPEKEYPKLVLKFSGLTPKKFAGRSKLENSNI